MFIVIIAPWPLDALFFKFQGLATDFSLWIDLGRLYRHNKSIHEKASVGTMIASSDDDEDESDEYTKECDILIQQLQQQQAEQEKQMDDDPKKAMLSLMVPVHKNISVLYTAAFLHAIGNALVTFSNHFYL